MKTLWNVITGDEKWVYRYDIKSTIITVGETSLWSESSKVKVILIIFFFFFWFDGYHSSWVCSMCLNTQQTVLLKISWSIWEWQHEERGLKVGETRSGCCTLTMHLLTCHSHLWNVGNTHMTLTFPRFPGLWVFTRFYLRQIMKHTSPFQLWQYTILLQSCRATTLQIWHCRGVFFLFPN